MASSTFSFACLTATAARLDALRRRAEGQVVLPDLREYGEAKAALVGVGDAEIRLCLLHLVAGKKAVENGDGEVEPGAPAVLEGEIRARVIVVGVCVELREIALAGQRDGLRLPPASFLPATAGRACARRRF